MSLRLYTGEFLVSPCALHLDMNWCSHGCWYCFANLSKPDRRFDSKWLSKTITALSEGYENTMESWLLKRGYPILASNTVDVFAKSNSIQFREVYESLSSLGARFTFQTRGGDENLLADCLGGPATMWYVSLTSDDDAILKRTEPGAPSHGARMDLIREAKRRGHHVVVGLNPCIPEQWNDWGGLLRDLSDAGVAHAWFGSLHLNRWQEENLTDRARRENAGLIAASRKKAVPADVIVLAEDAYRSGLNIYSHGSAWDNGFWDAYFDLGFPFWPTLDQWYSKLDSFGGGKPVVFSQSDLTEFCDVGLPSPKARYREFATNFGRSVRNKIKEGEAWRRPHELCKTMADVVDAMWQITDYPTILRQEKLAIACTYNDGQLVVFEDSDGRDLMVYVPDESVDVFFDVEAAGAVKFQRVEV